MCKTKTSKLVPGQILSVRELQMYANVCAEMKSKPNTNKLLEPTAPLRNGTSGSENHECTIGGELSSARVRSDSDIMACDHRLRNCIKE